MAENEVLTLFVNQTSNGTGSAVRLQPLIKSGIRQFDIEVSGNLGGGIISLEISHDEESTYVDWLLDGVIYSQSALGFNKLMTINMPVFVRSKLSESSGASVTVKLFAKFEPKK